MLIDCDRCEVRGDACADCVITVLLGPPPNLELNGAERRALDTLAAAGLVPRLRLLNCEQNHNAGLVWDASESSPGPCGERSASDAQRSGRHAV